jgi:hypothetical protein
MVEAPVIEGINKLLKGPRWEPLERFLPLVLCGEFMSMHDVLLCDGRRLHAYKHGATRRYLHLDDEGRPYESFGDGRYRRMRHRDAIEQAFHSWWVLEKAGEEEKQALGEAFETASAADHADYEAGLEVMPCSPACGFRTLPDADW